MPTGLERLKEEFGKKWKCEEHRIKGPFDEVYAAEGAKEGCESCITQVAAIVTSVMGVEFPQSRDPGPEIPMVRETTRAGAIYEKCRAIGKMIGKSVPPSTGFCLMLFEFNGHQLEWICNAQRPDMIKLIDEFKELLRKDMHP